MAEDTHYKEMKDELFKKIKQFNFVHIFLTCRVYVNSVHSQHKTKIIQGKVVEKKINLKPNPGYINERDHEFFLTVLHICNHEYWIVKLWIKMYQDAKASPMGKEIVRAFIINCLNVFSKLIVELGENHVDKSQLNKHNLDSNSDFLKKIFNISSIIRFMRQKKRNKLKELYKKNRYHSDIIKDRWQSLNASEDQLLEIFEKNKLSGFKDLVLTCYRHYPDSKPIKEPLEAILFFFKHLQHRHKIRKEIVKMLQEE